MKKRKRTIIPRPLKVKPARNFYSVEEVASMLGMCRTAVFAACNRNEIPGMKKIGRRTLISKPVFDSWSTLGIKPSGVRQLSLDECLARIRELTV